MACQGGCMEGAGGRDRSIVEHKALDNSSPQHGDHPLHGCGTYSLIQQVQLQHNMQSTLHPVHTTPLAAPRRTPRHVLPRHHLPPRLLPIAKYWLWLHHDQLLLPLSRSHSLKHTVPAVLVLFLTRLRVRKLYACPCAPSRPVRPTRWMYVSRLPGKS